MKHILIIAVLLAGCTPNGENRSITAATDGISVVFLECFGWCSLTEGDGGGKVDIDREQDDAPFE
jgi:hypothetical protein